MLLDRFRSWLAPSWLRLLRPCGRVSWGGLAALRLTIELPLCWVCCTTFCNCVDLHPPCILLDLLHSVSKLSRLSTCLAFYQTYCTTFNSWVAFVLVLRSTGLIALRLTIELIGTCRALHQPYSTTSYNCIVLCLSCFPCLTFYQPYNLTLNDWAMNNTFRLITVSCALQSYFFCY